MNRHIVLRVVTKMMTPAIVLFALYVQFHGDFGPGGGFQAGVIMAVAFILYGFVFGLDAVRRVAPPNILCRLMAFGVALYAGVGVASLFLGGMYLDYDVLHPDTAHHVGQHYGIMAVEFGVGTTVASTMIMLYYAFASQTSEMKDGDW